MRIDAAVTESQTLAWSAKIAELKAAGRPVLSLGLGEPDFETPPHIVEAAHAAMKAGFTKYAAAAGLPELRAAIADKLSRDNGIPAKAEEIVVTPGAKNALYLAAAALLEPGDEAVNLSPCYVSNRPILKLAEPDSRLIDVPLRGPDFSLDTGALDRAVTDRTKLLLINYPNNPTGRMLDAREAAFLVSLLKRRPRLHLISDEIYESLELGGASRFSPASAADIRDRVVTVNGFSKAFAMTGWRVGYAHAAKPSAQRILKIHQQLNTNTAAFSQMAALAALQGTQEHREAFVGRLRANKAVYEAFLKSCPAVKGSRPEGGFFAFIDVSAARLKSDAFCAALLGETGVAMLPGVSFGPEADDYCRISLATTKGDLTKALELTRKFVEARAR